MSLKEIDNQCTRERAYIYDPLSPKKIFPKGKLKRKTTIAKIIINADKLTIKISL